ncbi:MAG: hypothetical protein R6U19_00605 [Bacteroidales bacterium]
MRTPSLFSALILFLFLLFPSCESGSLFSLRCDHCTDVVPDKGKSIIRFTINQENPKVVFYLYEGREPGKDTILQDTISSETYTIFLKTERDYCGQAVYHKGNTTIHAFDGGELKVEEIECEDDDPCYYAKVLNLDLRLLAD